MFYLFIYLFVGFGLSNLLASAYFKVNSIRWYYGANCRKQATIIAVNPILTIGPNQKDFEIKGLIIRIRDKKFSSVFCCHYRRSE